jgi:methionyl-tRNA formyltransferase
MRDADAIVAFQGLSADVCVMAFVTDIVPDEILQDPKLGTIQYHPSLLPLHRGPSSINWAVIQGDATTGLTIFWPDKGLDTGPVLLQKQVKIGPNDTTGSLYFEKLFPLGVSALAEAVTLVREGTAPRIEQDHSLATYESWCKASDVTIDWGNPVGDLHNLIRGSDPSPGSGTFFEGSEIRFYRTTRHDEVTGSTAGEVASVDDEGFTVAAIGGSLTVRRVKPAGPRKLAAGEWAKAIGLKPGDRFGSRA